MRTNTDLPERFFRVLLEEIRRTAPAHLEDTFTVAEIYQSLIPYRTHRDRLGVEINGDYEDALLRLLAGEGEYLTLESEPARTRIRRELEGSNPDTGIYREFATVEVRLNRDRASGGGSPAEVFVERAGTVKEDGMKGGIEGVEAAAAGALSVCPECGAALPARGESVRYCPECGGRVLPVACQECGETLEKSWKFCVSCGNPAPV